MSGETKNAAAVSLGRLGGLRGGPARAKSLSAAERAAISAKGGAARWKKERAARRAARRAAAPGA